MDSIKKSYFAYLSFLESFFNEDLHPQPSTTLGLFTTNSQLSNNNDSCLCALYAIQKSLLERSI